jgi:putative hydrolase of the HAD superfamily
MIRAVVFDLGGVIVDIRHTWLEAIAAAGVTAANSNPGRLGETAFLDDYNAGALSLHEDLELLAEFLGLEKPQDALEAHQAILGPETEGSLELMRSLRAQGVLTACLSNTNEAHWQRLRSPAHFPAIAAMDDWFASHILGVNKPDDRIYIAAEEGLRLQPSELFFFDDLAVNVAAAQQRGWQGAVIDPAGGQVGQMKAALAQAGLTV